MAGAIVDPIVIATQGIVYGGSAGAVVAMAIDGAFLAREDVKVPGVVVKPDGGREARDVSADHRTDPIGLLRRPRRHLLIIR